MSEMNEQTEILKEMLKWLKFAGLKEVRSVLTSTLDTEQKRLVYHMSDGELGSVPIGKAAKISDWTVRAYWQNWGRLGIMEPIKKGAGERYKKVFKLEDFGIELPKLSETQNKSVNENTEGEVQSN